MDAAVFDSGLVVVVSSGVVEGSGLVVGSGVVIGSGVVAMFVIFVMLL